MFAKDKAVGNKEEEELHNSGSASLHHNQNHSFGFKYKNRIASFLLMLQLNLNYFGLLFVLRKILGKQPTLKIFHLTHKIFFFNSWKHYKWLHFFALIPSALMTSKTSQELFLHASVQPCRYEFGHHRSKLVTWRSTIMQVSLFQQHCSPTLHLHHEGLFNVDPAAVDDHALVVRQVPVVGVLKLDGVEHRLSDTEAFSLSSRDHLNVILNTCRPTVCLTEKCKVSIFNDEV